MIVNVELVRGGPGLTPAWATPDQIIIFLPLFEMFLKVLDNIIMLDAYDNPHQSNDASTMENNPQENLVPTVDFTRNIC